MTVIGLDVGYSNLKLAVGEVGESPQAILRPAGAAPLDRLGERVGSGRRQDAIVVDIDGEPWAAAIEPMRFEGWQRSLHEDYAATPAYRALVKAALMLANRPVVDRLVTGLPVAQAQDPRRREALRRALLGWHVTERGAVEVADVRIVPQPIGAFVDPLWADLGADTLARIEEGTVLVLDAGFYSFWMARGRAHRLGPAGAPGRAFAVTGACAGRAAAPTRPGGALQPAMRAAGRGARIRATQRGQCRDDRAAGTAPARASARVSARVRLTEPVDAFSDVG
jgi:plasmid segregation protein ParM